MSTGNMPNPPDHLTTQAMAADVKGQSTSATGTPQAGASPTQAPEPAGAIETPQLPLEADMARIFQEQVDIIAQQMVYHAQMLTGVSALGTDPVSARLATLSIADALRTSTSAGAFHSLVNLGDAQIAQVNDRTMPFKFNSQVAGLLEGILVSTVSDTYKGDPARVRQARVVLQALFMPANEELQIRPKTIALSQAPAVGSDHEQLPEPKPAS